MSGKRVCRPMVCPEISEPGNAHWCCLGRALILHGYFTMSALSWYSWYCTGASLVPH